MRQVDVDFDMEKWKSYEREIIQPYTQELIKKALHSKGIATKSVVFRGGFAKPEDLDLLVETGSDYDNFNAEVVFNDVLYKRPATYAAPTERVGTEPWVRGLDPLFWALKGHRNGSEFNKVNTLVAYWKDKLIEVPQSDIYLFKELTPEAVACIINLNLNT